MALSDVLMCLFALPITPLTAFEVTHVKLHKKIERKQKYESLLWPNKVVHLQFLKLNIPGHLVFWADPLSDNARVSGIKNFQQQKSCSLNEVVAQVVSVCISGLTLSGLALDR